MTCNPISVQDVPTAENLSELGDTTNIILHRQHQVEKDVAFLKDSVSEILDQFKGFRNLPMVLGQVQSLLNGRRKCSTNDFNVACMCGSYNLASLRDFSLSNDMAELNQEGDKENGVKISDQNSLDSSNLRCEDVMVSPSCAVHASCNNLLVTTEDSANCNDNLPAVFKNAEDVRHVSVSVAPETMIKYTGTNDPITPPDKDFSSNPKEKEVAHTIEIPATDTPGEYMTWVLTCVYRVSPRW